MEAGVSGARRGRFSTQPVVLLLSIPGLEEGPGCVVTVPNACSQALKVSWLPREPPECFCSGIVTTGRIKSPKSCIVGLVWSKTD